MESLGISYSNPQYVYFLGVWVLAVAMTILTYRWRKKALALLSVAQFKDAFNKPRFRSLKSFCGLFGLFFLVLALIGPQWGQKENPIKAEGLDICFGMDLSRSMLAEDVTPSRLQSAKNQLSIFMGRMGGDRAALVGFAGSSFIAAPLTTDHNAILSFLNPMGPSYISDQSTNLAVGVDSCLAALGLDEVDNRLEISDSAAKVIVLVTDGEETGSDFRGAIAKAENLGVPIYTFAVGTARGAPIPLRTQRGVEYLKDPQNRRQNVISKLQDKRIKELARRTGGKIFYLTNGVEAWKDFEDSIADYKRESIEAGTKLDKEARFQWPLLLAFLLLLIDFFLPETGLRSTTQSGSKTLAWAAIVLLLFGASTPSYAQNNKEERKSVSESTLMPWTIFRNNQGVKQQLENELAGARQSFEEALSDSASNWQLRFNWANNRLLMGLGSNENEEAQQTQVSPQVVKEALGEFQKLRDDLLEILPEETAMSHPALKVLDYQTGLAHELLQEKPQALQAYYRAQANTAEMTTIQEESIEAIKRLLAEPPGGGGGGGGDDESDNKENEGEGSGEQQNQDFKKGEYDKSQAEFNSDEVSKDQAQKILESVGSKEQEVKKRKAQQDAEEQQSRRGDEEGQSIGRGKQW